jgi:hypothetical protein
MSNKFSKNSIKTKASSSSITYRRTQSNSKTNRRYGSTESRVRNLNTNKTNGSSSPCNSLASLCVSTLNNDDVNNMNSGTDDSHLFDSQVNKNNVESLYPPVRHLFSITKKKIKQRKQFTKRFVMMTIVKRKSS